MSLATLSRCPVPGCPLPPRPFLCSAHWPFVSPDVRGRIVRFARMLRGGLGEVPPTMRKLLGRALVDIRTAPEVHWNWADRVAVWLHRWLA